MKSTTEGNDNPDRAQDHDANRSEEDLGHLFQEAAKLVAHLIEKQLTLATAESCTGGLLGYLLTSVPGASAVYAEGFVTYSNRAKVLRLSVPPNLIETDGAVSDTVARAMALGAASAAGADLAISITGIAGPDGGSPEKPVGTVFLAAARGETVVSRRLDLGPFPREKIRRLTAAQALRLCLHMARALGES